MHHGEETARISLRSNPNKYLDPIRFWLKDGTGKQRESGIVHTAYNAEGGATFYEARFKFIAGEEVVSEDARNSLTKLFARVFHPLLFNKQLSDKEAGLPGTSDCDAADFISLPFRDRSLAF